MDEPVNSAQINECAEVSYGPYCSPDGLAFLQALEKPLCVSPAGIHEDIPAGDNCSFPVMIKLHYAELKLPPYKVLGI